MDSMDHNMDSRFLQSMGADQNILGDPVILSTPNSVGAMDFPVPLSPENDPINILLRPFDALPTEQRRGEEDVFWKMVNGDLEVSMKAHEEMAKRAAAEKARLAAIESQKALMMGAYNQTKIQGGADGEVIYESLVRPTKAVSKGEFPLMKLSTSTLAAGAGGSKPPAAISAAAKPVPKVVPKSVATKEVVEVELPPAQIEHKMDEFSKGLLANSNLHIHRTRHDPVNLYWSMPGFNETS